MFERNLSQELTERLVKRVELARLHKVIKEMGEDDVAYVVRLRQDYNEECIASLRREMVERDEAQVIRACQVFPVM